MVITSRYLTTIIYSLTIEFCDCRKNILETRSNDLTSENTVFEFPTVKQTQESTFQIPGDGWISIALKDIAYYLRNYKFNEWDRRYNQNNPDGDVGFYKVFPEPALKFLHWKVKQNCHKNFYKCIIYLHSVVETAPITRKDDLLTSINANVFPMNETSIIKLNTECKDAVSNADKTGIPFDGPTERFLWRTSASYFMCWYTLLETPALSMLGEHCDNFANCLDPIRGSRNHDYRANDSQSFMCAMYSFCPDPCCPMIYVKKTDQNYECNENPCLIHNHNNLWSKNTCKFDRKCNQNFNSVMANKWNISCNCEEQGFIWNSQFGMCVDKNECVIEENNCNNKTQDCLNVPGSFVCICKWGFIYDNKTKMCI